MTQTHTNGEAIDVGGRRLDRAAVAAIASRFGIRRVSLFGSAARGELRADSDIDLLVEFDDTVAPSLGTLVEVQDAFSAIMGGRPVDVATAAILRNPFRRRAIERDLLPLYAA